MSEKTHDQKMREVLLARYGNIDQLSFKHRLRFPLKRAGWGGVVGGGGWIMAWAFRGWRGGMGLEHD